MKLVAVVFCSLTLAACGGSASDKAGGKNPTKVTVLTFANGRGEGDGLRPFAAEVARLSGGTLRIEFKDQWRHGDPNFEAGVIRDVQAGKADLGWAGSRAFDDVGVRSFDALHAPLLIDSYPLEGRVLESATADRMLDDLKPLDVVGLGILPGPLRKAIGVSPLLRPEDYRGVTVAIQRSQVAEQTLLALGARPNAVSAGAPVDRYDAVEQDVAGIAGNEYDRHARQFTANVNLWARPSVVFMNPMALERLDARQRRALRGAAHAALDATLAGERTSDAEGAANLCRRGVTFLTATDADLAALRRAVQPVYDHLERDAQTKAAIAQIRALRAEGPTPPDAPACTASTPRPAAGAAARTPIDGVYVMTSTPKEMAGTPVELFSENYGKWRFVLNRGQMRYTQASEGASRWATAVYSVDGPLFTFKITDYGGEAPNGAAEKTGEEYTFSWSLDRDLLTLKPVKGKISPENFSVNAWRRVGDAP